jgi:uncharacterized protein
VATSVDFLGSYVRRVIDDEIDELFAQLPALLIDGPKGVGKTATATRRCRSVRRLDVASEREIVQADPAIIGRDPAPLLIDEWQRVPAVFDAVRRLVDHDPTGGRFLLTGSAPGTQTHSGAGRITTLRMRPLCLGERLPSQHGVSFRGLLDGEAAIEGRTEFALADYVDEIVAGGFPAMRHLTGRPLARQVDGYIERIVDHDLPEAGFNVRRPATVLAWLRAYAAATATTTSWDKIRDAATSGNADKPAKTTTQPYIELLTALRILDPIPAWIPSNNHLNALTGAPKHHLADPALAARLVKASATRLLTGASPSTSIPRDGTFLGGLFESLVALSVRTLAQPCDARVSHLRTRGGRHEIDFIVETDNGIVAIEAKMSAAITDAHVSHLRWVRHELGDDCTDVVVLNTGPEAYRRPDGVAVIPLALLTA